MSAKPARESSTELTGTRAALVNYLWLTDNPGHAIPRLADEFELSVAAIRWNLRHLEAAGLVTRAQGERNVPGGYGYYDPCQPPRAASRVPDLWRLTSAGLAYAASHPQSHNSLKENG